MRVTSGQTEVPFLAPEDNNDPTLPSMGSIQRLRRLFYARPALAFNHAEQWLVRRMARAGPMVARVALGIIFLWFGLLKFYPEVQPIDILAEKVLVILTLHLFQPATCLHVLAGVECIIGLGLLTGRFLRLTITLLFLQMPGTFLPFLLLPQETWVHFPYLPTFEGQYIIKNFVLIAVGILVGASVRGGRYIAHPAVAARAERVEVNLELHELQRKEQSVLDSDKE